MSKIKWSQNWCEHERGAKLLPFTNVFDILQAACVFCAVFVQYLGSSPVSKACGTGCTDEAVRKIIHHVGWTSVLYAEIFDINDCLGSGSSYQVTENVIDCICQKHQTSRYDNTGFYCNYSVIVCI